MSIASIWHSDDRRLLIGYNSYTANMGLKLPVSQYNFGGAITGIDNIRDFGGAPVEITKRFSALIETGKLLPEAEGTKIILHDIIVNTYCDGATGPDLVVEVRSQEDTAWSNVSQNTGTITAGTSALTGSSTAFGYSSSYPTVQLWRQLREAHRLSRRHGSSANAPSTQKNPAIAGTFNALTVTSTGTTPALAQLLQLIGSGHSATTTQL